MVIGSLQFNNISTNLSSSEGVIIIGGYEKARAACLRNAILDFDGEFFVIDCNNAFKSQVLKAEDWFKYINDKEISNFLLFLDQLITERKQALEQYVSLRDYYKHTQNQQHTGEIVLVINYQQKESSFNIECLHKLFSLIKDVQLLKKLSINVLFACESLNEVRFKDTLSRFSSKIYLGNDSIEDQIFLFEEPVYTSKPRRWH